MRPDRCPFCAPKSEEIIHEDEVFLVLWDHFPVSEGHALVVTRRHVRSWFDASETERTSLLRGVEIARETVANKHRPDGYNIGVNVGEAAGQTVFHLHVHVIPRYRGDVPNPRGGVRRAIPAKGDYRAKVGDIAEEAAMYATDVFAREMPPHDRGLIAGEDDPLLAHPSRISLAPIAWTWPSPSCSAVAWSCSSATFAIYSRAAASSDY